MDDHPPKGYVSIEDACSQMNKLVSVIGVLVDFMPACPTRKQDYQITFSITDQSQYHSCGSLKVKCFHKDLKKLPAVQGTGDVVILRNFRVSIWNGMVSLLLNHQSQWIVFPASTIPTGPDVQDPQMPYSKSQFIRTKPSPAECLYAIQLCNSQDRSLFTDPVEPPTSLEKPTPNGQVIKVFPAKDKFSLIQDVQLDCFYDLVGEVIRVFSGNGVIEMYVTDYTSHAHLFNYRWAHDKEDSTSRDGDKYGYISRKPDKQWPGPYGQRTLRVSLWGNHAFYAQENVKVGQHVMLRNVRIKIDQCSQLEGTMFDDMKFPDKVDVSILKSDQGRVVELKERAREYWEKNKAQKENYLQQIQGIKRSAGDANLNELSKKAKKNKKRAQKKRDRLNNDQEGDQEKGHDDNEESDKEKEAEGEAHGEAEEEPFDQRNLNKYVRANHPAYPVMPVSEILHKDLYCRTSPKGIKYRLPFLNVNCRACVRVVDFYPPRLEDFAIRVDPAKEQEKDPSSSDEEQDCHYNSPSESQATEKWQWRFCLLLEDGRSSSNTEQVDRLQLIVADMDAVFLLGMDARDLRKDGNALATLRENLFLLWGDLEEQKQAACLTTSAVPVSDPTLPSSTQITQTSSILQPLDPNTRRGPSPFKSKEFKEYMDNNIQPKKAKSSKSKSKTQSSTSEANPPAVESPPPPAQYPLLPRSSAKPFICCIKEYGVKVPAVKSRRQKDPRPPPASSISSQGEMAKGDERDEYKVLDMVDDDGYRWERRFQIWGTTIMA